MIHKWSIEHPYVVIAFYLAVIVTAVLTIVVYLPRRFMPYVESPMIGVVTMMPGLSSQEMEMYVSKPIEEQLVNVKNLHYIRSTSQDGFSIVSLEFNYGTDMKKALFDVQSLMNVIQANLPATGANLKPSWVLAIDPLNLPILSLSVTGDKRWDKVRLREFVDNEVVNRAQDDPAGLLGGPVRRLQAAASGDRGPRQARGVQALDGAADPIGGRLGESTDENGLEQVLVGPRGQHQHRFLVSDAVERVHRTVGFERRPYRGQLGQHAAHGEEVAPAVDRQAQHLLGRHVLRSSDDRTRRGRFADPGDAEVHDLGVAALHDEDVAGLDVAVDDSGPVGLRETIEHLDNEGDLAAQAEVRLLAKEVIQVPALQEFHDDVRRAVRVIPEIEDRHHVGMHHPGGGTGLPLEAQPVLGHFCEVREHHLQRNVALEVSIGGLVDRAHSPAAEQGHDAVLADLRQVCRDRTRIGRGPRRGAAHALWDRRRARSGAGDGGGTP